MLTLQPITAHQNPSAQFTRILREASDPRLLNPGGKEDSEYEIHGDNAQLAGIQIPPDTFIKYARLCGGKQGGAHFLDLGNGRGVFRLGPDIGMTPWCFIQRDPNVRGWNYFNSPSAIEMTAPWFLDHEKSGGIGWIQNFTGSNPAIGKHAGPVSTVKGVNNVGMEVEEHFHLHGDFGRLPARNIMVSIVSKPVPSLEAVADFIDDDTHPFGSPF